MYITNILVQKYVLSIILIVKLFLPAFDGYPFCFLLTTNYLKSRFSVNVTLFPGYVLILFTQNNKIQKNEFNIIFLLSIYPANIAIKTLLHYIRIKKNPLLMTLILNTYNKKAITQKQQDKEVYL